MATAGQNGPCDTGAEDSQKKQGTRVFKKSSPNGKITTYLGKRDFIDHLTHIDPIDGVVLVDPEYLKDRKVYAHILAAFRYGREDLDVLGLTFRKDLYLSSLQVYPPIKDQTEPKPLTRLQERLIKKLGPNAYPFFFELPPNAPASVTLQPAPGDTGKPCGVDYELKTFVADSMDEKPHKRNSVRLAVRKLTYAPEQPAPQPSAEAVKDFMMSPGSIRLEASLDKEKYYHGESIAVNVLVDNNTNKTVKKIKLSVIQLTEVLLYEMTSKTFEVFENDFTEGFPIQPSQTGFCKVFHLTPLLANNRDKRGLALDGKLKHEDTNLASSTIMTKDSQKENLGIVVSYRVKVKLVLGFGSGSFYPKDCYVWLWNMFCPNCLTLITSYMKDFVEYTSDLSVELPFTLTHPKPVESPSMSQSMLHEDMIPVDTNLIKLDTNGEPFFSDKDDDFIFEDFARLRLKGHDGDDTEA